MLKLTPKHVPLTVTESLDLRGELADAPPAEIVRKLTTLRPRMTAAALLSLAELLCGECTTVAELDEVARPALDALRAHEPDDGYRLNDNQIITLLKLLPARREAITREPARQQFGFGFAAVAR